MIQQLDISHLGHRGDGVAAGQDGDIYVPYALPAETIEAEVQGQRGRLISVIRPSPERIAAFCPHFGVCGGCILQNVQEEQYHAWKQALVSTALAQAGLHCTADPMMDAHGQGRRRATFHARKGRSGGLAVGYAAQKSHQIVPIAACPILAPDMAGALDAARAIASALAVTDKPLDLAFTATLGGLDCDVRGSGPLSPAHIEQLSALARTHGLARLSRHGERVVQYASPNIQMGVTLVDLPAGAFLQPTVEGENTLSHLVCDALSGCPRIADLFCGVGTFTLRLARCARLRAYDSHAPSIDALIRAARAPGLKQVQATARDLFRSPVSASELTDTDGIVINPPRQGAEAQCDTLARSTVPRIVMVSCSLASFVRDARILTAGGYRLIRLTPVDQFKWSAHIECVGVFRRMG